MARRDALLADVRRLDRLISKADGDTGFNERFLCCLDNDDVLAVYHENAHASEDALARLVASMQNYINARKLNT